MLPGAGLGGDPRFAHPRGEQCLTEGIVNLVRTCVTEILALQIDLGAAQACGQVGAMKERGRSADIFASEAFKLVATNPSEYLESETVTRTEYKKPQPKTGWSHAIKEQVLGSNSKQ